MKEQGNLSQWLKERCKTEHLSLRKASARTDLSHATIRDIIKGGRPYPETIIKLAQGFGGNGAQRLALEDHLLVLAGYRTARPEEKLTEEDYLRIIPFLRPEYQHLIEVVVIELAKIEGIEIPPGLSEAVARQDST